MAYIRWKGDAKAVAQVDTFTPANVNIGNTFTVTINGKSITVTATAATVANVCGLLVTALNASTIPEFAEITWANATTHVTGTADTAGVPFTATSSASGGTATLTRAAGTACAGPNHADDVTNYTGGALPGNGDTLEIADTSVSILYGLTALAGVTLAALYIRRTYTGQIGLPRVNRSGGSPYTEYRADYFQAPATITDICTINCPLAKIDSLAVQIAGVARGCGAGSADVDGGFGFIWKGTHTSNAWVIEEPGNYAFAPFGNESAAVNSLKADDGDLTAGSGCAWQSGGSLLWASSGTITVNSAPPDSPVIARGTLVQNEGNCVTPVVYNGATLDYRGAGTVSTPALQPGAVIRFDGNPRARTVSGTIPIYRGTQFIDPNKTCNVGGTTTFTRPDGTLLDDTQVNLGPARTYAVSG